MYKLYTNELYEELLREGHKDFQCAGIYAITIKKRIVYIGKSKNILYRIASHMACIICGDRGKKYQILTEAQDKYELTVEFSVLYKSRKKDETRISNDIGEQEGIFIRKYLPCLNTQVPKVEDWHKYTINNITDVQNVDVMLRMIGLESLIKQREGQSISHQ